MAEGPLLEMTGLSDVGRVRDHNEDAIRWDDAAGWAILADGMGGHLAGEVASSMAVDTIAAYLSSMDEMDTGSVGNRLCQAIEAANGNIHQRAQDDQRCYNMGTTVVAVILRNERLSCAHVGDSRLYRFNEEGLTQLTHDHSLVQELVDEGMLSSEEAADSVHKNVITRALGLGETVTADLTQLPVHAGDLFLLCSDGLSDSLTEAQLTRWLESGDLVEMARALVDEANAQGGKDNISLILMRVA